MVHVKRFIFNPIEENTYVLYTEQGDAAIIDCGCMSEREQDELARFIRGHNLSPRLLLNTHLHFDHVWGNAWAVQEWPDLDVFCHHADLAMPAKPSEQLRLFGINNPLINLPDERYKLIRQGDLLQLGNLSIEVRYVPGHSPGHIAFYLPTEGIVFSGDALFKYEIGRTDLWGGSYTQLLESIRTQLFSLPITTIVYPGHGPETSIGDEMQYNPYFQ